MYTFSGKIERPLNATLVTDYERLGIQVLIKQRIVNDYLKFYIHPGTIHLNTDKLIKNAIFSGSVINADNERLKALLKIIDDQQRSISNQIRSRNYLIRSDEGLPLSAKDSSKVRDGLFKQLDSLARATKPIVKKFIEANPNSYISLLELWSYGGSFPNLAIIEPMYDRLSSSVKKTLLGQEYRKFLQDRKSLIAGATSRDFTQNDTAGKPVNLSSFKGKYVLLEFWASWCGPCRKENPNLVQIYKDFKDENFTILAVSLDGAKSKNAWIKAIKDDGLSWTHVSDLKKWDNAVAKLYSINAIPQNFLIGPDGIIIARGLDHKELRKKLEEIKLK